jgi:chemotaxis protein methyltransferase CheR
MNLTGYSTFRRTVLELTGIDLDCYKETQMERRLQVIMKRAEAPDLASYARVLMQSPVRLKEFRDFLTINVSEWLRNPEKYDELKELILPELLTRSPRLKIWSAGCSNGSEPYSVAMILDELDPGGEHTILATDIDEEILKIARAGTYHEKDLRAVAGERRSRYFAQSGDQFTVRAEVRSRVRFERHNLLADHFPSGCDLILCRNVVIYFTEEAKEQLYRRFHRSLKPGGVLFVGGTESLLRARELGFAMISPFFYRAVVSNAGSSD